MCIILYCWYEIGKFICLLFFMLCIICTKRFHVIWIYRFCKYSKCIIFSNIYRRRSWLANFLEKNLVYPKDARKQKIEGIVITEFTVGADGFASNIEIVKSVYPSLDAEAIKLIHRSAWIPAVNAYGQAVKYRMRQPIEFHL